MKMIDKLKVKCWNCDGAGNVVDEITGKSEPWLQQEIELTCDKCEGKGYEIDKDELPYRLEDIRDMIEGMQVRMRLHSDMIKTCEKGMLYELMSKYRDRLDTSARAYARLKRIESKLEAL